MSFLQKAKEKAREAADASAKAASAVAAKAQDPVTQAKLRTGLASAGRTAGDVAKEAADASSKAASAVAAKAQDPATQARVKSGIAAAGRGARTMVERIDPGILADVIIKATALQEKANARLRRKGSIYRIGEIQVTASLPPGISFAIVRVGEVDDEAPVELHSSLELLAADHAEAETVGSDGGAGIVSLDGEQQAAIAFEIDEAETSMDAVVDAIATAEAPVAEQAAGPDEAEPTEGNTPATPA